jgi:hypothetical protein
MKQTKTTMVYGKYPVTPSKKTPTYKKNNKESSADPRCESSTYSKEDIYRESRESSSKFRR